MPDFRLDIQHERIEIKAEEQQAKVRQRPRVKISAGKVWGLCRLHRGGAQWQGPILGESTYTCPVPQRNKNFFLLRNPNKPPDRKNREKPANQSRPCHPVIFVDECHFPL